MIDASKLFGSGVKNVPAGHFFTPVDPKSREMFLGGYAQGQRVLIALKEMAYALAHQWDRPNGFFVSGARIMVDPDSAKQATDEFKPGAIMLIEDRVAIAKSTGSHDRLAIAIDRGQDLPRQSGSNDIAFTRWQAVVCEGEDKDTVYSFNDAQPAIRIL